MCHLIFEFLTIVAVLGDGFIYYFSMFALCTYWKQFQSFRSLSPSILDLVRLEDKMLFQTSFSFTIVLNVHSMEYIVRPYLSRSHC